MKTPLNDPRDQAPINLAINGNFDIFQRVSLLDPTQVLAAASGTKFAADRFSQFTAGPTAKSVTVTFSSSVPGPTLVGERPTRSLEITANSTTVFASNDRYVALRHCLEGYDARHIVNRTASHVSFMFFATTAGRYPCRVYNSQGRTYLTNFIYSVPNVWQFITVRIPTESTTFFLNNESSLVFLIGQGGSATNGTDGIWQVGDLDQDPGLVYVNMLTAGLVMRISQFSWVAGEVPVDQFGFKSRGANIGEELKLCERYFEKTYDFNDIYGAAPIEGGMALAVAITTSRVLMTNGGTFKTRKRAKPQVVTFSRQGAVSSIGLWNASNDIPATFDATALNRLSQWGFQEVVVPGATLTIGSTYWFHYTADAEIT